METQLLLAGLDEVPWARLVHFYGRASDIPPAIRALGGPGRVAAAHHLRGCLEHQDSITQATPFAVRFILLLREIDSDGVETIINPIAAAARFMIQNRKEVPSSAEWSDLLREDRLWPPFTSERDDEIRWEEWSPEPQEWLGWAILTLREVADAGAGVKS